MTPKQFLKRINKAIQNEELNFYTEEDENTFEPKPLEIPYEPTTIDEMVACIMNEWATNWLYNNLGYSDTPYFRTPKTDTTIQEVLDKHLNIEGMYIEIKADHSGIVLAGVALPKFEDQEPEQHIQAFIEEFLLDITEGAGDFKADNEFRECFNPARREISVQDLLDDLNADEEQFSEISKDAYNEYKKYRL